MALLAILVAFQAVYVTSQCTQWAYIMTDEVGTGCSCPGGTTRYACLGTCQDNIGLFPGMNQAGYVGANVSSDPDGWYYEVYGIGWLYPCNDTSMEGGGTFLCGECKWLHTYQRSNGTYYTMCLKRTDCWNEDNIYIPPTEDQEGKLDSYVPPHDKLTSSKSKEEQPSLKSSKKEQPTSVLPPINSKAEIQEHYEKTTSREVYDRVTNEGSNSDSSPIADDNWRARVPESWKKYFTSSNPPQPQNLANTPVTSISDNSWSTVSILLLFLTIIVSFGTVGYVYKRVSKRSQYEPVPDVADNDSLLFT